MNIARLFTQTGSLRTYLGESAYEPIFAVPVNVACFAEDTNRLVRNSSGEEVVSSTRVRAAISLAGQFTPRSLFTINGREAEVISVSRKDEAGPARIHHVEVNLI